MMMDLRIRLSQQLVLGTYLFLTRGDGDYTSFWGWGGPWYAGWYDPWYWGHTGIIRIGDIPVMDGIHQDRLLDPV